MLNYTVLPLKKLISIICIKLLKKKKKLINWNKNVFKKYIIYYYHCKNFLGNNCLDIRC